MPRLGSCRTISTNGSEVTTRNGRIKAAGVSASRRCKHSLTPSPLRGKKRSLPDHHQQRTGHLQKGTVCKIKYKLLQLLVGAAAIFYARKLRPPDRALLCCDLLYAYLSHLSRSPRHTFLMGLSGLWSIHHRLQRYPLHGCVDDLARDLLALRICQTPDRSGFGSDRRGASFPRSQGSHADSSRETVGGAKGAQLS